MPVQRLDPTFFGPRSGQLGELTQKFVNYRVRLVILGDLSGYTASSTALRDFISESNRGQAVWFVNDLAELETRLT
ncbi:DUF4180 domain-containing protein [Deinococcus sp.]|uniref:DUF4180 domain-containing protein n=1 Tax=Deinococcus sp. TaxID=47478 RepID=UPI0025EB5F2B|nr:DUF4180 domain-containing protein [Deinococcus sp.]